MKIFRTSGLSTVRIYFGFCVLKNIKNSYCGPSLGFENNQNHLRVMVFESEIDFIFAINIDYN